MSELIDRQAFIEKERRLYCEDCDRRKGKKNGKLTVCYEIGEAPCRACWLDDALGDLEDFPTASPWHRVEEEEPTKAGWYLAMDVDGDFNVDEWHNTFGWQFITPSDADRITHWMPIEPPKEDE